MRASEKAMSATIRLFHGFYMIDVERISFRLSFPEEDPGGHGIALRGAGLPTTPFHGSR